MPTEPFDPERLAGTLGSQASHDAPTLDGSEAPHPELPPTLALEAEGPLPESLETLAFDARRGTSPDSPATVALTADSGATIDVGVPGARTEQATGDFHLGTGAAGAATVDMTATGAFDSGHQPTEVEPSAAPPSRTSSPGALRCGRYHLTKFHAKGGMGEIWLAEDPAIGRSVALKRMLGRQPEQVRRFEVEAAVTGQLEHPGIVPVHELGVNDEGQPYYVMKFVQGRTLQKVIEEYHAGDPNRPDREVELFRLLQMFLSLCQTVAYAHSRGVLHRDLKPENVMLGPYGETLLLDWGIAKVLGRPDESPDETVNSQQGGALGGDTDTNTRYGAIMGTPMYMAPEVAAGSTDEIDHRSDIYLLGGTLYEILTGRHPRDGKTAMEMVKKARSDPPTPARLINPEVPRALEAICRKAMALGREDRYQSALELAEDVQRFVAGESVSAFPEGFPARAWRWAKRHRKALTRTAATILILGSALFAVATVREAERGRAEALKITARLKGEEQARLDLKEFRRLADEARYYAATTDPVSENAPYFDPKQGVALASKAQALAAKWGPTLEGLPLRDEVEPLKRDLYELALLVAGPRPDQDHPPAADAMPTPLTALDDFALGEHYRRQANFRPVEQTDWKPWLPDTPLMEKAIAQYRSAIQIDPDHYWSHLQIGRCTMRLGRFAEAVEALGTCLALRPEAPWGYQTRALAFGQQKRFTEAEQDLAQAIRLNPGSRVPILHRALLAFEQGKDKAALADLDAVLAPPKEKRLVEGAFYRGMLHASLGEVDKALDDFNAVLAEMPVLRRPYLHRARIYASRGESTMALDDLDHYLEGSVDANRDWRLHARRGWLLRFLYTELPREKRRLPAGRALVNLGMSEFLKAIRMGGRSSELFDDTGAMLEHTGQVDQAILAYSEGLKLAPDDARLRIKRGWAFELKNRHDDAFNDFAATTRSSPENAEAHTGLGYLQALRKNPAEAQREADLALLHGSDKYLILHNVACIYAALSETAGGQTPAFQETAVAILRRSIQLWKLAETGPDEIDRIQGEPAFRPLRGRTDFQQLIRRDSAKTGHSG